MFISLLRNSIVVTIIMITLVIMTIHVVAVSTEVIVIILAAAAAAAVGIMNVTTALNTVTLENVYAVCALLSVLQLEKASIVRSKVRSRLFQGARMSMQATGANGKGISYVIEVFDITVKVR